MGSYSDKTKGIVEGAIEELQGLATLALKSNSYSDVAEIARIAEKLHCVLAEDGSQAQPPPVSKSSSQHQPPKKSSTSRKRSSGKYPKFRRDGDKLVKVGWSKKARAEYEHRAPFLAVDALIASIAKKVGTGEYFKMPDVLPLTASDGQSLPDYQGYLVLKWLHVSGLVDKRGRDSYALAPGEDHAKEIDALLAGLEPI